MVSQPLGQNAQFVIQECIKLEGLKNLRELIDMETSLVDLDFPFLLAGNVTGAKEKAAGFSVIRNFFCVFGGSGLWISRNDNNIAGM